MSLASGRAKGFIHGLRLSWRGGVLLVLKPIQSFCAIGSFPANMATEAGKVEAEEAQSQCMACGQKGGEIDKDSCGRFWVSAPMWRVSARTVQRDTRLWWRW